MEDRREDEGQRNMPVGDRLGVIRDIDAPIEKNGVNMLPLFLMILLLTRNPWQNGCGPWNNRNFF